MLIATFSQPQLVLAETFSAATADVTKNVSNVLQIFCGNGDETEVSGSGVVVNGWTILTNAHVITDEATSEHYEWCFGMWSNNAYTEPDQWVYLEPSGYERYDDSFDYAFMTPYDEEGELYEFDSYATLANGDSMTLSEGVSVMGFPGTSSTITITTGTISSFEHDWIKTDARIDAGNSGGAAFDVIGNLFGIPTAVSGVYSSTLSWIQNINAILEDAFGADAAERDYSTMYTEENIFCLAGTCYNYAPDEDTWGGAEVSESTIDIPEEAISLSEAEEETTSADNLTYSVPSHGAYNSVYFDSSLQSRLKGHILLQTQQHGEAWYIHPTLCYRIYLEDGSAAYDTMRYLSLGVSDENLTKLPFSSTMTFK